MAITGKESRMTDTKPVPAVTVEQASDAGKTPAELFRYTTYVHLGEGADACEDACTGLCEDAAHFHAFVRLPNQFQHADIRRRAQADKARRLRQLRDPESDAATVLDADMAELLRVGDMVALVDELVNKEWWKDHLEAMREVEELELYEHITADRERLQQISELPADKQPADERDELTKHTQAYSDAVEAKRDELQAPRRQALESLAPEKLVELVREDRIEAEATAQFMETYSKWEWFSGTLRPPGRPAQKLYDSIEALEDESPEIIDAIRAAFQDLERSFQRGPTGNS
jgi:hypothetical protein